MAEGGVDEDSNEMLGPTLTPVLHTMQTPAPSNFSSREEVRNNLQLSLVLVPFNINMWSIFLNKKWRIS